MEDRILASAASNGDPAAFTALVERYRAYVYAIAYRIVLHEDDALDIAQTVFLRLVERIGDFEGRGPFRRWLAAIAVREALSHRRRERRREEPTDPDTLDRLREDPAGGAVARSGSHMATSGGMAARNRTPGGGADSGGGVDSVASGRSALSPPQVVLRNERRARVEAAMAELSPQQRAVFTLRFKEDMDSKEIAERLDLQPGQVRVQLCRAVVRLRELVGEE